MRILITGSRTWPNDGTVETLIDDEIEAWARLNGDEMFPVTIVHGGAKGADQYASNYVKAKDDPSFVVEEVHLADWSKGRSAGIVRNIEMIQSDIDMCLAFIHNSSRGASHCASAARRAGIMVKEYRK